MTKEQIARLAKELRFLPIDPVLKLARSAMVLLPFPDVAALATASRLGGLPALPRGATWPSHEDRSLAFIAQINLRQLPPSLESQGFPTSGLLSFFYDAEQSSWGFDPADRGSFAVLFSAEQGLAQVERWPSDLPDHARYRPCALAASETVTLPPVESAQVERLRLSDAELDLYDALLERVAAEPPRANRTLLGGYPDQIQGDLMLECELVSAGLCCGGEGPDVDPRLPALKRRAVDWRQLLQVHSCADAGMLWGDAGCLYFSLREQDLRARRFEAAWMVLQCC